MAGIILPRKQSLVNQPTRTNPIIDWSHPLSRGLIFDMGGHTMSGQSARNNVFGEVATFGTGVSATRSSRGPAIAFSGTQSYSTCYIPDHDRYDGLTSATWQLIWWGGASKPFSKWGSYKNAWLIQTGTGLTWIAAEDSSGLRRRWDATTAIFNTTGAINHAILSWQGGANKTLIVNGVDRTSSLSDINTSATVQRNSYDVVQLGIASDGNPLNGGIILARMWNRGLTNKECFELSINPYQIYEPSQNTIIIPVGSGPNEYTITPSGSLVFNGTASNLHEKLLQTSGEITLSGTANITFTAGANTYTISPTGEIVFSGNAKCTIDHNIISTGELVFTGSAGLTYQGATYTYTIVPTGGIQFSGNTTFIQENVISASGTIAFNGNSVISINKEMHPTGGIIFAGTAMTVRDVVFKPNGSIQISGSAPIYMPGMAVETTKLPLTGVGT